MNNFNYRIYLVSDYLKKINLSQKIIFFFLRRKILIAGGAGAIA